MSELEYKTPPSWLIHQLCYPDGSVRLKPLPQREYGYSRIGHGSHSSFSYHNGWRGCDSRLPVHYRAPNNGAVVVQIGNLKMTDYAFFAGCNGTLATWRQCRYCGNTFFNDGPAALHKRTEDQQVRASHARLLQWMAKLLSARGDCVICGAPTRHRKWGYPVCFTQNCIDAFMFTAKCTYTAHWLEAKHVVLDELAGPMEGRIVCR